MDATPVILFFVLTLAVVIGATEIGYRLGKAAVRYTDEGKESPVGAIAGAILALLAFVLAFTFSIASDRYDTRKALVREEANAIRTAFLRSDFLPETDRAEAQSLLVEYVNLRLAPFKTGNLEALEAAILSSLGLQSQLWDMAVANARLDMNSDVAALYIESLNEIETISASRVSIGLQTRIPGIIWIALYGLIALGMLAVGYQGAIAGSSRSWAAIILAISFSVVITLIAILDRPATNIAAVSQQPLENVRLWMQAEMTDLGPTK